MNVGGIILCGGKSSRMGAAKALLPFGDELMLQRVARLLGKAVSPLVVVAAPGQVLPPLPPSIILAYDEREGRGPLEGLAAGLKALPGDVDAAYATSCDVPLLIPEFVSRMIQLLGDQQIAVPECEGFCHPLSAVYRREVLPVVEQLLAEDRLRPMFLFDQVATRRVAAEELIDIDPQLATLQNCNYPEDYQSALRVAGLKGEIPNNDPNAL